MYYFIFIIFNREAMREFIINDLLKLRLEDNKTIIYINEVKIIQCKYLMLNEPSFIGETKKENPKDLSVDSQSEHLNHSLELIEKNGIPPEVEFWAHSSNLQAWYEHSYNTHLLHSNLSFPLLKRLSQAGDKVAKQIFKKEIIKRFRDGNLNVMVFLIIEGYLDELGIEESDDLYEELDFETRKKLFKRLRESEKRNTFIL
ncbi:hypothetical protein LCGC14_0632400 [marine sediment metagenome]|uniref:Uncharacterized protein n=1 Tax=marine sediment metagenome TaxID=412755 RepID=A0A0F9RL01_9ZZZZ|nr:MAG: hypothetical protein Lokiarch_46000 [Candidatus Lokiarchaeum sp. GC14_75]